MKKKTSKQLLSGLGLNSREEAVYLAVMHGGKVSQSDIASTTGINRTSLYPILNELAKRDFIIKTIKGRRLYYTAESPEKLLKKAKQAHAVLAAAVPGLMDIYTTSGHKPKISVHNGPEGLFKVSKDAALLSNNHMKSFSSPSTFLSVLGWKEANEIIKIIEEREVTTYALASHTEANKKILPSFNDVRGLNWRLMPEGVEYPIEFMTYNKTTVITSWGRQFAVVIESEDITNFLESLFDYFWQLPSKAS